MAAPVLVVFGGFAVERLRKRYLKTAFNDFEADGDRRIVAGETDAREIAVVETAGWKVLANLDAGAKPTRIALQHDEKYLWVGNETEDGGVTVIDWVTGKRVAHFKTGPGHHDIALTDDDRYAFVTNRQTGTLSVIDVPRLTLIKEVVIGSQPSALGYSSLSKAVYVTGESDGTIVAVGGPRAAVDVRAAL